MGFSGLATFPEDTQVIYSPEYAFSTNPGLRGVDTFVRSVVLVPPMFSFCSLERILERSDKQLDRVAEYAGGRVVPHQWGLIRQNEARPYKGLRHLFGNGYYLVAEVSRIEPVQEPPGTQQSILKAIDRFHNRPSLRRKLNDIRPCQFMYGYDVNSQNRLTIPYLVDIEPKYRDPVASGL